MQKRLREFRVQGTRVMLGGGVFGLAREIYGRQVYFAQPGFRLKSGDVVVDLGANVGVFTTLAARIASKVIAVEAQSGFIEQIGANLALNDVADKVSIEFGLIGPESGVFSDVERLRSSSHFKELPPVLSMNELLAQHKVQLVDFLKIDIEGSEFHLFRDNPEWLRRVKKVAMEVHPEFGNVDHLVAALAAQDFKVALVSLSGGPVEGATGSAGYLFATKISA